jgi:hypothetical protein
MRRESGENPWNLFSTRSAVADRIDELWTRSSVCRFAPSMAAREACSIVAAPRVRDRQWHSRTWATFTVTVTPSISTTWWLQSNWQASPGEKFSGTNAAAEDAVRSLKIAVNLSPEQFHSGSRLLSSVTAALERSGLPPQRLELEITESVLLADDTATLHNRLAVPSGGYRLARPASEIMVGTVVRALDGPLAPIACASRTAFEPCTDCGDVRMCPVRQIMVRVRDAIAGVLDTTSLAQLAAPDAADGKVNRFADTLGAREADGR